jgi:hypothetical protein
MRLYVVWVHGGGEQRAGESRDFEERVWKAFRRAVRAAGRPAPPREALAWVEAYWADLTQQEQDAFIERTGMRGWFRRFIISNVGDAIAYSKLPFPPDNYTNIQERFARTLEAVSRAARDEMPGQAASLTVVAHSLGTVIASDGIYDLGPAFPANLSFDYFFTPSALMALYSLRYGVQEFGSPVRPQKGWWNFFYAKDLLGYPLRVNAAYEQVVTEDVLLSPVGDVNPLRGALHAIASLLPGVGHVWSHLWYFTDRAVIGRIANALAERWLSEP